MGTNQVVIIVPIYQNSLSYNDLFSLSQCFNVLKNHKIVAIKPSSLDLGELQKTYKFDDVISFEDKYFTGIAGYNELLLSTFFYKSFLAYKFMLIYQLDAFVFEDKLAFWCEKNYDYLGAPWLYPSSEGDFFNNFILSLKTLIYKKFNIRRNGLPNAKQFRNQVGNGGFSLRKTEAFHNTLIRNKELATAYIHRPELEFNEDIFFSIAVNRNHYSLKTPNYKLAIKFSIETEPEMALRLNKGELPFGCHAWDKSIDFWLPILEKYGYRKN